jgi:hypothetical protein
VVFAGESIAIGQRRIASAAKIVRDPLLFIPLRVF